MRSSAPLRAGWLALGAVLVCLSGCSEILAGVLPALPALALDEAFALFLGHVEQVTLVVVKVAFKGGYCAAAYQPEFVADGA